MSRVPEDFGEPWKVHVTPDGRTLLESVGGMPMVSIPIISSSAQDVALIRARDCVNACAGIMHPVDTVPKLHQTLAALCNHVRRYVSVMEDDLEEVVMDAEALIETRCLVVALGDES